MSKNEKKIILLLVEGDCDELLLINRLRDLFQDNEVRFSVQRGDIFYDTSKQVKSIKGVIGDAVKAFLSKNKFKATDLLCVIHVMDTDGCFIPESGVIIEDTQEELTSYMQDRIQVKSEKQRNRILERNKMRSNKVEMMRVTNDILPSKINYQLFYFSRNLEHVLFDNPNPIAVSKMTDIENFLEGLTQPVEQFFAQFLNYDAKKNYQDKHLESWDDISNGLSSLKRSTNVPLLFEYLTKLVLV